MAATGTTNERADPGTSPHPATDRGRVVSLDALRGLAIAAMVIAHTKVFVQASSPHVVNVVTDVLNDVASPLFALVIGLTAAHNTVGAARWAAERRNSFIVSWCLRAVAIMALAWPLQWQFSGAVVVLEYLGATMLVATPFLFAGPRVLLGATASLVVVGPFLNEAARDSTWAASSTGVVGTMLDWTVLGPVYRVTGLLPLLLIGLLLGRRPVRDRRRLVVLATAAGVVAAVAHAALQRGTQTSGSTADLARDIGMSLFVYGVVVLAADRPSTLWRPIRDMGRVSLSIYALHLVVLMAVWQHTDQAYDLAAEGGWKGWALMTGLLVGCAVFAMTWTRWFGRGPLERLLGVLSLRHSPRSLLDLSPTSRSEPAPG